MLSPITTLDTLIQKGVDHAAFAVMRTLGVRKSFVAYLIYSLVAASLIIHCVIRHGSARGSVATLAIAFGWFWYALWRLRRDDAADSAGMLSIGDTQLGWCKAMWFGMLIATVLRGEWAGITQNALLLVAEYLCGTPKDPPPKEKRETAMSAVGDGA